MNVKGDPIEINTMKAIKDLLNNNNLSQLQIKMAALRPQ